MRSGNELATGERSRYARQSRLSEIGEAGQHRLEAATVALVGVGGLGSVAAELFCRAGVGNLILIDRDIVELSNLHRQSLYTEADARAGLLKTEAASRRLREINREPRITPLSEELVPRNAVRLLEAADLIIDGTDNHYTRQIINETALGLGIPWVHGAATATYGVVLPFMPGGKPCFRCYAPPKEGGGAGGCALTGVLAATTHIVAARQVAEGMRVLITGEATRGVLYIDPWYGVEQRLEVPPRRDCPSCGEARVEAAEPQLALRELEQPPKYEELCGENTIRVRPGRDRSLSLAALRAGLPEEALISSADGVLRFWVEEADVTLFGDGRALVRGAGSPERARRIYAEYVGG